MRAALAAVCLIGCGSWLSGVGAAPAHALKTAPTPDSSSTIYATPGAGRMAPGDPTFQFTDVTAAAGIR